MVAELRRCMLSPLCALAAGGDARLGAAAKVAWGGTLLRLTILNAGR
jgi:hypothetical protein